MIGETGAGLLVFGGGGQLGRELRGLAPDARFVGRDEADLRRPDSVASAIRGAAPAAVVNAAAWTAVDDAEDHPEDAHAVNAGAPGAMAAAAAGIGVPLVHVSTDYVFAGTGTRAHRPEDPTGPLGVYGASKLAGEQAIGAQGGVYAVIRTSWVFSAHGANFVKTMLRLAETRTQLRVVSDQVGGPTPAASLASACLSAAARLVKDPAAAGTYHFAGAPDISWADFARTIFREAGLPVQVEDIPTSEFPTRAPRPLNSRLDCTAFERTFGLGRPDWRAALRDVLHDLGAGPVPP